MIAKAAILVLFGTSLTSGQFWPHMAPLKSTGCPSGPELAPLICKFMLPNMDQLKPQLIAPTTYIAPLIVEKCDSPQLQMDIEIPAPAEEAKPLVIPQPPELPPMTIPKFPVPVIIEAPPTPLHEPCESAVIPVMPVVNIPGAPKVPPPPFFDEEGIPELNDNTIEYFPISIPQPPKLPAFIMPEIPIHVLEQEEPMVVAPCAEDETIPAPIPVPVEPLAPLPAAPELPAFTMPELPIQVVELPMPVAPFIEDVPIPAHVEPLAPLPAAPELPAFTMPELPIEVLTQVAPMPIAPCLEDEPIPAPIPAHFELLAPLPAAPELPAFAMPELPIQVVEPMPVAPFLEDQPIPTPIPAYIEPLAPLPAAPELPAFTMPELPIKILAQEVPMPIAPCLEDEPISAPIPAYFEPLAPLPAAPELPAFVMPVLPEQDIPMPSHEDFAAPIVVVPEYFEPISPIPAAPELPPTSLPELSIPMEIPSPPVFIAEPEPYHIEEKAASEPIIIPQPPKLPEVPVRMAIDEPAPCEPTFLMPSPFYQKLFPSLITTYSEKPKETQNILLSPMEGAYPTPCVYNLVMNHVVPNMVSNNFRSMENIEIQPAPFVPCS